MNLVARFPDKLCVLPNKSIDSDVMEILKPKLVKHAADSNEMVAVPCCSSRSCSLSAATRWTCLAPCFRGVNALRTLGRRLGVRRGEHDSARGGVQKEGVEDR